MVVSSERLAPPFLTEAINYFADPEAVRKSEEKQRKQRVKNTKEFVKIAQSLLPEPPVDSVAQGERVVAETQPLSFERAGSEQQIDVRLQRSFYRGSMSRTHTEITWMLIVGGNKEEQGRSLFSIERYRDSTYPKDNSLLIRNYQGKVAGDEEIATALNIIKQLAFILPPKK